MALRREFGQVQAAHCWPADRQCLLPQLQQDTNRRGDDGSNPSWSAARGEACDGYQLANDTLTMLKGHSDPFTATRNRFLDTRCLLKQTAQSKLSPVFLLSLSLARELGESGRLVGYNGLCASVVGECCLFSKGRAQKWSGLGMGRK